MIPPSKAVDPNVRHANMQGEIISVNGEKGAVDKDPFGEELINIMSDISEIDYKQVMASPIIRN